MINLMCKTFYESQQRLCLLKLSADHKPTNGPTTNFVDVSEETLLQLHVVLSGLGGWVVIAWL